MARFPRFRIRNYSPKTRQVSLVGTLDSMTEVRSFLRKEHKGGLDTAVESSKHNRIYVQKIVGRRRDGGLITKHINVSLPSRR